MLHSFSGGVFLGTFLLHLLPECVSHTEALLSEHKTYPLAESIIAAGMFLMLTIEQVNLFTSDAQF